MKQLENVIIYILLLVIGFLFLKRKKENFEVQYPPYYPITSNVNPKYNNYNNSIEDKRLDILKKSLDKVRLDSNDGNSEFKEFNKINLPVIKSNLSLTDIKPVIDFILNKTNSHLLKGQSLTLDEVNDINKYETEKEVKINFKLTCQYIIKTHDDIKIVKQEYLNNNNKENRLIIIVEILSIKTYEKEDIYINYIQITGLTGGQNLPGKNYYDNSNQFMFSDFEYNNIINKKKGLNSEEVNNLNVMIQDEESIVNDITVDESNEETIINTEEAESFFNI